jgi:peptidoglycan/xylan/chitin deacetylase (PgdA/CDA1 family)
MRVQSWIIVPAAALLLDVVGLWRISKATRWQLGGELVWQVPTSARVIALTFDDGPVPGHVDEVLEVLRARNARATLFLTGEGIATDRSDAANILAAGHEIGNHSYSHQRMVLRSGAFIREDIEETDRLIRGLGASGEILFRPPYGKKLFALPRYLAAHHRKTITWTVEAEADPSHGQDAASVADHVFANVRPGAIVLFHVLMPSRAAERRALPIALDRLADAGYRFVTVSDLLALPRS